jgi:DtxR family Mn-dependent transcriptional regulator
MPRGVARACPADPTAVRDNGQVSDLIDTTEMYLRTIFELSEEGILPMRARITERLGQSGPTVSQTVARMQRDGLVELDADDRHLVLTDSGSALATQVMRKHRLAECLLVDVIGLPWESVHTEACRWEHVMSESVERRLVEILGNPTISPFGNPIPGLGELGGARAARSTPQLPGESVAVAAQDGARQMTVVRISETLQADETTMGALRSIAAMPGDRVEVSLVFGGVRIEGQGGSLELSGVQAKQVFVAA